MIEAAQPITATPVDNDSRLNFLPGKLGKYWIVFENRVYDTMRQLCQDYSGGSWSFYNLSNGGFFMAPDLPPEPITLANPENYSHEQFSSQVAGIVCCLYALSQLSFVYVKTDNPFSERYHQLYDYVTTLPERERTQIYKLCD